MDPMHMTWNWRTAAAAAKIPETTKLIEDRHVALMKPDDAMAGRLKRNIEALGWRIIDSTDFSTPPLHTYDLHFVDDYKG